MSFARRLIGALLLRSSTYEEIERDHSATVQAAFVVILASAAQGLRWLPYGGARGVLIGTAWALLSWSVWAALLWIIGTHLMPESATQADVWQLLRTIGFAASPGILGALAAVIPSIAATLSIVIAIWVVIATILAVRQALDYTSTIHAVAACLIALGIMLALVIAAGYMLGYGMQTVS